MLHKVLFFRFFFLHLNIWKNHSTAKGKLFPTAARCGAACPSGVRLCRTEQENTQGRAATVMAVTVYFACSFPRSPNPMKRESWRHKRLDSHWPRGRSLTSSFCAAQQLLIGVNEHHVLLNIYCASSSVFLKSKPGNARLEFLSCHSEAVTFLWLQSPALSGSGVWI